MEGKGTIIYMYVAQLEEDGPARPTSIAAKLTHAANSLTNSSSQWYT